MVIPIIYKLFYKSVKNHLKYFFLKKTQINSSFSAYLRGSKLMIIKTFSNLIYFQVEAQKLESKFSSADFHPNEGKVQSQNLKLDFIKIDSKVKSVLFSKNFLVFSINFKSQTLKKHFLIFVLNIESQILKLQSLLGEQKTKSVISLGNFLKKDFLNPKIRLISRFFTGHLGRILDFLQFYKLFLNSVRNGSHCS